MGAFATFEIHFRLKPLFVDSDGGVQDTRAMLRVPKGLGRRADLAGALFSRVLGRVSLQLECVVVFALRLG